MINETFLYVSPNDSVCPYHNLAREEAFLQGLLPGQMILYLWQNKDTVVIGRNQNCFKECRVSLLEEEGGHLARRLSGGGAVFHDLGNLNYTFLAMKEDFDIGRQTGIILEAVRSFGIPAGATGRNDIEVNGRKFSGNAYYRTKGACYQHGTLLVSVDEKKIDRYLSVDREKLRSKGVDSVRSRVIGLSELSDKISVESLKERIAKAFREAFPKAGFHLLQEEPEGTRKLTEKYGSSEWLYGNRFDYTYQIERKFPWGKTEMHFSVMKGMIKRAVLYTDALETTFPERVARALEGKSFSPEAVREALLPFTTDESTGEIVPDIINWIEESM
ncbi:MAG: lipoate--protein ligase [Firmicutes bacterium]|nr:lipoate--protein ligase [Bacillota bacterium]